MKNWNYIEGAKIGNIKDDAKAKELFKKMMDAKEIAEEWGRASNYQKKDNLEGGRKAAEDAYRKAKKEYEDYAMNSKAGNETLHEYATSKPRVINEEKTGAEEFFKKLSDDVKEREEKDDAEMLRIAKTTPHDSAATESEMRKDVSEWVLSHGKPEDFVNNKRTGNEASDDKFAYVMREFDEGKLKTPDGKVVTDPAQAKAIAYSESKKTENGLARARKAMNAWNSERKIEPVGKYREFIDNLKNAIELGTAGVLYNSLDEQTVKEWVEKAKKEGYGSHISGVQGKKVILK